MAYSDGLGALRKLGGANRFGPRIGPFQDWNDPAAVITELEQLKQRQREINMSANPAFGGNRGLPRMTTGSLGPIALTPEAGKAAGNTNIEFWENNEKIRALEDLAGGGVGSGWRTKRAPVVQGMTPPSLAYSPNAPETTGLEGEESMGQGQGLASLQALSSQGRGAAITDRDLAARLAVAATRRAEAEAAAAEAGTPRGQREAAEAGMNQTIANLRGGRTGYVAGGMADIETGVAGQRAAGAREIAREQAISEAETMFTGPVAQAQGVAHGRKLEEIRAGKVEPANVTGAWRAAQAGITQQGMGDRATMESQARILVAALNDYTRAATNISLSAEDRASADAAAREIKNYLKSIGVDLEGGMTAPGPPIR